MRPDLSVVIPAFHEETRLPASLEALAAHLSGRKEPLSFEVVVVDDGSADRTAARAEETGRRLGLSLRLVRFSANRGKGAAVRAGVLAAEGKQVLVSDADFSTPIGEWEKLAAAGAPVAIGSRAVDESLVKERQPLARVLAGKLFNLVVRAVVLPGIRDTQCGFKLFSHEAARAIFPRTTVDRFAWDVEALLLARRLGFPIAEVPVLWFDSPDSRVTLLGGAQAYLDVLSVRRRVARTMKSSG
jgi:dolichyl-phosphate beta-glucosyltransferase